MSEISPSEILLRADREFQVGNYTEAIRLCYEGLRNFPEFPSLYSLLSQSYIRLGKIDEAIKVVEQAMELFPFQRTFPLLLEKLRSEIASTPTKTAGSDAGRNIYSSIVKHSSKKIFSHYLLFRPIHTFVNVPRNYFATRIDLPNIPKPRKIGLLGPISRLINIV